MTSTTRTVLTEHGEIDYETVGCDSCGAEVVKEDAFRFLLIEQEGIREVEEWANFTVWKVENGGHATGYACPLCAESDGGPIDYPSPEPLTGRVRRFVRGFGMDVDVDISPMGLLFCLIPLLGVGIAVDMLADPPSEGERTAALIGVTLHLVAFCFVIFLLI